MDGHIENDDLGHAHRGFCALHFSVRSPRTNLPDRDGNAQVYDRPSTGFVIHRNDNPASCAH